MDFPFAVRIWFVTAIGKLVFTLRLIQGTCTVTVELAGAEASVGTMPIVPDFIRGMANWVLEKCVRGPGRLGGFVTGNLASYRDWLLAGSIVHPGIQHYTPSRKFCRIQQPQSNLDAALTYY